MYLPSQFNSKDICASVQMHDNSKSLDDQTALDNQADRDRNGEEQQSQLSLAQVSDRMLNVAPRSSLAMGTTFVTNKDVDVSAHLDSGAVEMTELSSCNGGRSDANTLVQSDQSLTSSVTSLNPHPKSRINHTESAIVASSLSPATSASSIVKAVLVDDDTLVKTRRSVVLAQAAKGVQTFVFFLWPRVFSVTFNFYVCHRVGTTYYIHDFSPSVCYDDAWYNHLPINILFAILVVIGIPLIYFFTLLHFHRRHRLREPIIRLSLGFIYDAYLPHAWWFEMVDFSLKFLAISIAPFLPPSFQLPFMLVALLLTGLLIYFVAPYKRAGEDRLHLLALHSLISLSLIGYICQYYNVIYSLVGGEAYLSHNNKYNLGNSNRATYDFSTVVLLLAFALFFIVFLRQAYLIWKLYKKQSDYTTAPTITLTPQMYTKGIENNQMNIETL